jgi:hypothetical protein
MDGPTCSGMIEPGMIEAGMLAPALAGRKYLE